MYKKMISLLFYSYSISKIALIKLFVIEIILFPVLIVLRFVSYIGLVFSYRFFLLLNDISLKIMIMFSPIVKNKLDKIKINLKQFFYLEESKKNIKMLSMKSFKIRYYDILMINNIFLFLFRKKRMINIALSMKLNNNSGYKLSYFNKRKVIYCHMHSSKKLTSILKIESMTCPESRVLYVQRAAPKIFKKYVQDISLLLGKKNVIMHDPLHETSTGLGFLKKIKKSDSIHIYVDLTKYLARKNFSETKINFLGKNTFIIDGFARLAIATNAICIPVFVNGNEVNLLPSIDTLTLVNDDKIQELMQRVYDELSQILTMYPENWNHLEDTETYFRNIKLKGKN